MKHKIRILVGGALVNEAHCGNDFVAFGGRLTILHNQACGLP